MHRKRLVPALALSTALTASLLVGAASPAAGAGYPETVPLPDSSSPEGISGGPGSTFFAGSRNGLGIVRGDLRTGASDVLVTGTQVPVAVGMLYDERSGLLWVAGGDTGVLHAFDGRTGETVYAATVPAAQGAPRVFLNDVAITRDAVVVTDSAAARLITVPLTRGGQPDGDAAPLPLGGDYVQPAGFGANGIRELPGGDLVVVSGGVLYRVDPATGAADAFQVSGRPLTGGDGLELRGTRLYVVQGYGRNQAGPGNDDSVVVVDLDLASTTGTVVGELTDPQLDRPTTGTLGPAGSIWVVNGRFETTTATTFDVVRVDL